MGIRFMGESVCDEKFFIERACSDLTSFEYIVDGEGTLEIEGQILHPRRGDVFFLQKGSKHKYYCYNDNGWRKYFISFYGPVADFLISSYLPENTYLFKNCFIENAFKRMFDIAFNSDDMQKAQSLLAVEIFRVFNFLRDRRITENEDFADKIKRNIENHLSEDFNLDNICRDMNYSKNHIINIFSQKFSVTPYKYYIDCKINSAKDYLSNTALTVNEISNLLAYSNQQYFSYCFKKEVGCSPRKYRELTKV